MGRVCPLCNGISRFQAPCVKCQNPLEDAGLVTDYVGPYSPYDLSPREFHDEDQCVHLLHCPNCGKESYAIIKNGII